jgi:hypothetical protein
MNGLMQCNTSFPDHEQQRALNTLRYIHANPKTAGMRKGYFYAYSNYGIYDRLTDDGLTEWHPVFLSMGQSLDACQKRYQRIPHGCFLFVSRSKHKSNHKPQGWEVPDHSYSAG